MRQLNLAQTLQITGVSRSSLYRLIESQGFPKPHKIRGISRMAWWEHEVALWLQGGSEGVFSERIEGQAEQSIIRACRALYPGAERVVLDLKTEAITAK